MRPTTDRRTRPNLFALAAGMLLILGAGLAPSPVGATTMTYTDVGTLVEISDVLLRGTVESRESFHHDGQGKIVTHTTIRVEDTYMGEPGRTVTIEQWGGTVGGETVAIPGDASFETGEEVVVFLKEPDDRDVHFLSALAQSKYHVSRRDDRALVSRDLSEIHFADGGPPRIEEGVRTLTSFVAELRSLIYAERSNASKGDRRE